MHEFRSAILTGDVKSALDPVSRKERCRRQDGRGPSLIELAIPRAERRVTNQRREDRFHGVVERATIVFRRKKSLVRVVNLSPSGVMIESGIIPRIGEKVGLEFDGFDRLEAVVRWVKQGRIGLDVGEGAIDLG
ncbi:MAG TPA: PilZ domain-containing protein [Allosphingosinicella sp.]|nr:PilZ domain-containing protein [Allosphingosinicella sp.]